MSPLLMVLLLVPIVVPLTSAHNDPRVFVTLYHKQLEDLALHWRDWMTDEFVPGRPIASVNGSSFIGDVWMTDGTIESITVGKVKWSASTGGVLRLVLKNVTVTVGAQWGLNVHGSAHQGRVRSQVVNVVIDLWYIKTTVEQGYPYIESNIGCSANVSDESLKLNLSDGDFDGWKTMILNLFTHNIRPVVLRQTRHLLCAESVAAISAYMQTFTPLLDLLVEPADEIYLDGRLDRKPIVTKEPLSIQLSSKAMIYYNNHSVPATSNASIVYDPPQPSDHNAHSHLHYQLSLHQSVLTDLARGLLHADRLVHVISITSTGVLLAVECTLDMHARLPNQRSKYVASLALIVRFECQAQFNVSDTYFYLDDASTKALTPTLKTEQYSPEYNANFTSHQISRFLNEFIKFVKQKMVAHVKVPLPLIVVPGNTLPRVKPTIVHSPGWLHVFV